MGRLKMKPLTRQDNEFYAPTLICEQCGRNTRHFRTGSEEKMWQCFRVDPDHKDVQETSDEDLRFMALNYRCIECGTVRGYGSIDVERLSDGEANYRV